jgi:hypothetical protein
MAEMVAQSGAGSSTVASAGANAANA